MDELNKDAWTEVDRCRRALAAASAAAYEATLAVTRARDAWFAALENVKSVPDEEIYDD